MDELFATPEPLLCCGDDVFLRGGRRAAVTFAPLPPGAAGALDRSFGAGFLLIDEQVIVAGCYAALLSLVTIKTWRGTATTHADHLVLNRYFARPIKPWLPETMLRWTQGDPKDKPRNAFRLWYDVLSYLAAAHVRSVADRLAGNRECTTFPAPATIWWT